MPKALFVAAALLVAAVLPGGAWAQSVQVGAAPAGVHLAGGGFVDPEGRPLYEFGWDTMKGMSHCVGACAKTWNPFVAGSDAKPMGDWSIIERGDGSHQWAYKDKPLYTFSKDTAGKPATGVSMNWTLAN